MKYRKVAPLSRKSIRKAAKILRDELNLSGVLYIPIVDIYEILQRCEILEFEILSKEDMGNDEGLTFPDKNWIQIREDVYEGAVAGVSKDRMTLAHELGHLFLHRGSSVSFARNRLEIKAYEDPEWQAKCFGGEFMIPKELCESMSEEEICEDCGVSYEAACVQKNAFDK